MMNGQHNGFQVLLDHADFVIINKPTGISVHKDDNERGLCECVADQLGVAQLWLVHRLDKVTSGLLILAKNAEAAAIFGKLFEQHQIQKTYLALSPDKPKKKQGKVSGDMKKARNGSYKLTQCHANPAITHFNSVSLAPRCRLFVLRPQTGKTHQLRVMMKSLGSPILGDALYQGYEADRVYLHAYRLQFCYQKQDIDVMFLPNQGENWQLDLLQGALLEFQSAEKGLKTLDKTS